MAEHLFTHEFSICLLPNEDITIDINSLRQDLPESPYRDDIPHITILRGISTNDHLSDEDLLNKVDSLLAISNKLPISGSVHSVANASNRYYSLSSGMKLHASKELLNFRNEVITRLKANGFSIETQELANYIPHITIRLGAPLIGESLTRAEALFVGRSVSFNEWFLFRVIKQNDRRIMHEIWPEQT